MTIHLYFHQPSHWDILWCDPVPTQMSCLVLQMPYNYAYLFSALISDVTGVGKFPFPPTDIKAAQLIYFCYHWQNGDRSHTDKSGNLKSIHQAINHLATHCPKTKFGNLKYDTAWYTYSNNHFSHDISHTPISCKFCYSSNSVRLKTFWSTGDQDHSKIAFILVWYLPCLAWQTELCLNFWNHMFYSQFLRLFGNRLCFALMSDSCSAYKIVESEIYIFIGYSGQTASSSEPQAAQMPSGLKLEPMSVLQYPGNKDGEIKVVNENGDGMAYSWNANL